MPQAVESVYVMCAKPAATPVTTPPPLIVAIEVLPLDHVPPVLLLVSVDVPPWQIVVGPLIVPADIDELTVKLVVTLVGPQLLLTV